MILIAAIDTKTNIIGKRVDGKEIIPWSVPGELAHFKNMTIGRTVLFGRKTAEVVGILPERHLLVLTRDPQSVGHLVSEMVPTGFYQQVEDANGNIKEEEIKVVVSGYHPIDMEQVKTLKELPIFHEIFVGGGTETYRALSDYIETMVISWVNEPQLVFDMQETPDSFTYFPMELFDKFEESQSQDYGNFTVKTYERVSQ